MLTASSQPTSPPTAHGAYLDHVVDAGYHRQLFATHVDLFPAMSALRQVAGGESTDGTGNVKAGDGGVARAKTLAELEAAVGACRNAAGDGRARLDGEVETEQMERLHGQVETVQPLPADTSYDRHIDSALIKALADFTTTMRAFRDKFATEMDAAAASPTLVSSPKTAFGPSDCTLIRLADKAVAYRKLQDDRSTLRQQLSQLRSMVDQLSPEEDGTNLLCEYSAAMEEAMQLMSDDRDDSPM